MFGSHVERCDVLPAEDWAQTPQYTNMYWGVLSRSCAAVMWGGERGHGDPSLAS